MNARTSRVPGRYFCEVMPMPLRSTSSAIGAVARCNRVAGVEHDLALERAAVVLADLRQRAVGHRDEQRIAERDRLGDRAGLRKRAEPRHQVLQLFGMAGRKQHRMAGLDPQAPDRAADVPRADNSDAGLCAFVGLCKGGPRLQRSIHRDRTAGSKGSAAGPIKRHALAHC